MFQIRNLLKVALRSIVRNRMRSLLTSLGIIIGVCAVIVMVAIGEGSQVKIERQIASLGTNILVVFPASMRMGGVSQGSGSFNQLTLEDAEVLRDEGTLFAGVSPLVRAGGQAIGGGNNWNTQISGVSTEYPAIRAWEIESGEFFTERDIVSNAKVAVIGKAIADELFPGEDPVGERIQVRNTPFKIVGVMEERGQSPMGMDEDDVVLAPATTVLNRLKGGRYIDMINISAVSTEQMEAAEAEIETILRKAHGIEFGEDNDFNIRSQADLTEAATETTRVLTVLLGSIAAVSLMVGGIGIMNIMLVSVTERTREIGIRLSIGARPGDILTQFLAESVVLSVIGGVLGILLALGISLGLGSFTGLTVVVNPVIVLLAFSVSGAVGIFFGFYPARKAAALNPIDALRYE
ncbi:MAG: ABC transporter permease [bacterium]|jgi:putative ABC transport system permease protein